MSLQGLLKDLKATYEKGQPSSGEAAADRVLTPTSNESKGKQVAGDDDAGLPPIPPEITLPDTEEMLRAIQSAKSPTMPLPDSPRESIEDVAPGDALSMVSDVATLVSRVDTLEAGVKGQRQDLVTLTASVNTMREEMTKMQTMLLEHMRATRRSVSVPTAIVEQEEHEEKEKATAEQLAIREGLETPQPVSLGKLAVPKRQRRGRLE